MNDNEDNKTEEPTYATITSLEKFKKEGRVWPKHEPKPESTPQVEVDPKKRLLIITLADDDEVLIEGYVGLTGSFLCVGNEDGTIKFAVAAGHWKFVADVTDDPEFNGQGEE